jgi:hypothetical protein
VKYLQILNVTWLVLGGAMSIVLAVVCLLYWVYLDSHPELRRDLPVLLTVTGGFAGLAASGALAFFGNRRAWMLRWPLQILPVLPLAMLLLFAASFR